MFILLYRCCSLIVIDVVRFSILFVNIYGISMHINSFPSRIYVSNFVLKKMQNKSCITNMVMGRTLCAVAVVGALVFPLPSWCVCVFGAGVINVVHFLVRIGSDRFD